MQEAVQAELAALETETEQPDAAEFALNFLWLDKNIAVAVDQLFDKVSSHFGLHWFCVLMAQTLGPCPQRMHLTALLTATWRSLGWTGVCCQS